MRSRVSPEPFLTLPMPEPDDKSKNFRGLFLPEPDDKVGRAIGFCGPSPEPDDKNRSSGPRYSCM
jgi:hypothetical protein